MANHLMSPYLKRFILTSEAVKTAAGMGFGQLVG